MRTLLALVVLAATPLAAQSVDPGMSREQVVERLGKPMGERATGSFIYLFYRNGCEQRCGMSDVVILENDAVVDAIFRSSRQFSGASTSPAGVTPEPTRVARAGISAEEPSQAPTPSVAPAPSIAPAQPATPTGALMVQPSTDAPTPGGLVFSNDAKASAAAQSVAAPGAKRIMRVNAGTAIRSPTARPATGDTAHSPGVRLTPGVATPHTPPVPRPDSTSIPPHPSVPDQKTGVSPAQHRPAPHDSARLERQQHQRQPTDSIRKP